MRLLPPCKKSIGEEANGKEKKQQAHCGRAGGSRTKVVQDHPSTPCSMRAGDAGDGSVQRKENQRQRQREASKWNKKANGLGLHQINSDQDTDC